MAELFDPHFQAVDSSGAPYSGALLYFYTAGTTTQITTYQDSAATTPHANPVVADSAGLFAPIYVTDGPFKTVLKTSGGVTVQTVDNINSDAPVEVAFSTRALAAAYSPYTAPDIIRTNGYYAAGDGGGAMYKKVGSEPSHGGKFSITLADGATTVWYEYAELVANVRGFGAKGDGVADDTAEIQSAIDYQEGSSGGVVYLPDGTYLVSDTLTVDTSGVVLRGDGMFTSIIYRSSDYGHTLEFTGNDVAGTTITDVGVTGLGFQSAALTTSGAHLRMNGVARAKVSGVYMLRGFIGFDLLGVTASNFSDIYLVFDNIFGGAATSRRYAKFSSAAAAYGHPSCGDLFFSDFNLRGNTSGTVTEAGIEIRSADGLWFDNGHVGNTTVSNMLMNAVDASNPIDLVFFNGVMFDECTGTGTTFQGSSAIGRNIQFSNCNWKGGGTGTIGIATDAATTFNNVQFSNSFVTEFNSYGIDLTGANLLKWSFTGCQVRGNSFTTPGTVSGIRITGGDGISIVGGSSGGSNVAPGSSTQTYGIEVGASPLNIIIDGVDLRNNTVAPTSIDAGAMDQVFISNLRTSESSTVASASTITLPIAFNIISISGTTNITSITESYIGRVVVLTFQGALTVVEGSNLTMAGNFTSTAGSTLTLIGTGGSGWYEVSRMTN